MKIKTRKRQPIPTPRPPRRSEPEPVERERRVPLGLEEVYREAKGKPYCCFVRLTREMAHDWVANHLEPEKQRTLKPSNIVTMQRLQKAELWSDYKAQVVFDDHREVRNGQHSLHSLTDENAVSGGFIIQLLINIPASICNDWDQIQKRTIADQLKIMGEKEHRQILGATAKVLWQYLKGHYGGMGYMFDRQPGKIATAVEGTLTLTQNEDLRQCIFPFNDCFEGRPFSRVAVYAAYCMLRRIDQEDAEEFFDCLNDGTGLTRKDDPRWVLRNLFSGLKERKRNGETMALVFKAWNLYQAGEKIATLKMGKNEPFPVLEPMEIPDGPQGKGLRH